MSEATAGRFPETPRLVLTLTVAGFLSGLVIVSVDAWTRPLIAANRAAALERAVFEVLPGAERMQELTLDDEPEASVYAGYNSDGELAGYAIAGDGGGYQDTIRLIYGFDPTRRRVVGMRVLESRETPGLGDRIYKDEAFVASFRDLAVEPQVVLVSGAATADNEVAGLTGATISSRAVVRIINRSNERWLERLAQEPPAGGSR